MCINYRKNYSDLLTNKVFSKTGEAKEQLSGENDRVFWIETGLIWGYSTKSLMLKAINDVNVDDDVELDIKNELIDMCKHLRMNEDCSRATSPQYTYNKMTLAQYIGLDKPSNDILKYSEATTKEQWKAFI